LNGWGGQHSPLKRYIMAIFLRAEKPSEDFFSYEYERVKGRIIIEEYPHMQIHVGIFEKAGDQLPL
jgi:hypothetical protein